MTATLDAASRELRRGRQPIPIPHGEKAPRLPQWQELHLTADELPDYFRSDSNIGVLNGEPSGGLIDVDLDCPEAAHLADRFLPPTDSVFGRTGRPRSHRLYICEAVPQTTKFNDVDGTTLLELRSTGTQTVIPPSIHPSGEPIMWHTDGAPALVQDKLLLMSVGKTAAACILARHWPTKGGRHDAALALAGALARFGWAEDDVAGFIKAVARAAGDEETNERGIAARYSAARLAEGGTATGWPTLVRLVGSNVVEKVCKWLDASNSEHSEQTETSWEDPVPLTEYSLPPFPSAIFPDWIRAYIDALVMATQTPVTLAAMLMLAVLAAACAKRVVVQVKPDWYEPVNLFTATVLAPAERKSAVFRDVTHPFMEFEAEEIVRLRPIIAREELRRETLEGELATAKKELARCYESGQIPLYSRADELEVQLATMKVPASPRFVVDDCSPERLATLLFEQDGRMAVMAPEGDVFDMMAGRYGQAKMPNFGVYLRGHAGDDLRVDRVTRDAEFVHSPALTVGLTIQPTVLHGLTIRPEFRGRGLLARFLYGLPLSMLGRRDADPPPVPEIVRNEYNARMKALLRIEPEIAVDKWGDRIPHQLTLSSEADERFQAFREALEPRLGEFGDLGHIADWAGKLAGAIARIAGLLHMAERAGRSEPWSEPISGDVMRNAIRLGESFLIPHALAAFDQMGANPATADARYVLRVLADRDLNAFTARDLHQVVKGRLKTMEPLRAALGVLEEQGYIRRAQEVERTGPGRRPSPQFEVNPLWRRDRADTTLRPCSNLAGDAEGVAGAPSNFSQFSEPLSGAQ